MPISGKIKRLEVAGGFLGGLSIEFSPRLNCIIGSRGSGKTTLLEIMRLALQDQGESGIPPKVDRLIRANLGLAQVRLTVAYDDAPNADYELIKSYGAKRECKLNGEVIGSLGFPVSIYSTDEIEDVADDPDGSRKRSLIDSFKSEKIRTMKSSAVTLRAQVRENSTRLINLRAEVSHLKEEVSPLVIFRERLNDLLKDAQNTLDSEYRIEEEFERQRVREREAVETAKDQVAAALKAGEAFSIVLVEGLKLLQESLPTTSQNDDVMQNLSASASAAFTKLTELSDNALKEFGSLNSHIGAFESALQERHNRQIIKYLDLQKAHAASTEKVKEISETRTKVEELERKKERLDVAERELISLEAARSELLSRLHSQMEYITAERQAIAEFINSAFVVDKENPQQPNIFVEILQGADKADFVRNLQSAFQGSKMRYGQLVEQIAEKVNPEQFIQSVLASDVAWFKSTFGLDESRSLTIISHLQSQYEILLNMSISEIDDLVNIYLNVSDDGSSNYKESSELSTGQKCTSILPILLLAADQGPLIIDQPENNLDNQYIFSDVVPRLEAIKWNRQLIFVTHNPNIPVLADAEQVIVLSPSTSEGSVSGSVACSGEVEVTKDAIINILEGGAEAFEARSQKYRLKTLV